MISGLWSAARLAAVAFVCMPVAAMAQEAAPQPQAAGCELHIWPAERFAAITTGWLGGGLIDVAAHAKGESILRYRKIAPRHPPV